MKLSNKNYDILCYISRYLLPAIGTLYFAIAEIWNLPFATEIVGTITAIVTFMNTLLKLSSNKYYNDKSEEGEE